MIDRRFSDLGLDEHAISDALDQISRIRTHVGGGPAPDDVKRVIAIFEGKFREDAAVLEARCEQVKVERDVHLR